MAITRGTQTINHYRGDSYVIQWTMRDLDRTTGVYTPIDITNYDLLMQIRTDATSDSVLYQPVLEKVDPVNGVFRWDIKPSVSESIGVLNGVFDIQLRTQDADEDLEKILTFITGVFKTSVDVSRSTTLKAYPEDERLPCIEGSIRRAKVSK